jgi:hypothetical protein
LARTLVCAPSAPTLSGLAIRASQKLRVSHRSASRQIVGYFIIALSELKQPLPHHFAMMR